MKKKWVGLLIVVVSILGLSFLHFHIDSFCPGETIVYADMNDADSVGDATGGQYGTPSETTTNYTVDSAPDRVFTSYVDSGDMFDKLVNSIVQALFWVAKVIYRFTVFVSSFFGSIQLIKSYSSSVVSAASSMWQTIFSSGLFYLMALGVLINLCVSFVKGTFLRTIGKIIFVFFLLGLFFTQGSTLINKAFTASNNISTSIISNVKIGGVSAEKSNQRNTMMVHPFLLLNFDVKNLPNATDKKVAALLNSGGDVDKVKDVEGNGGSRIQHLQMSSIGDKFSVALGTIINNIVLATVIVGFEFGVFVMQILFLVFLILVPFTALASFFPQMQDALLNLFKKASGYFVLAFVLSFGIYLVLLFNNFLDFILTNKLNNQLDYLFVAVIKVGVMVVIWKKRQEIFSVFHPSMLSLANTGMLGRARQAFTTVKERTISPALSAVGGFAGGAAAYSFDKVRSGFGNARMKQTLNRQSQKMDQEQNRQTQQGQYEGEGRNRFSSLRFDQASEKYDKKVEKTLGKTNGETGFRNKVDQFRQNNFNRYSYASQKGKNRL